MREEHVTIIAESFEAAARQYRRSRLAGTGYRTATRITMQTFEMVTDTNHQVLFDGKPMYAVTFSRTVA
jgi:hypothetical protein